MLDIIPWKLSSFLSTNMDVLCYSKKSGLIISGLSLHLENKTMYTIFTVTIWKCALKMVIKYYKVLFFLIRLIKFFLEATDLKIIRLEIMLSIIFKRKLHWSIYASDWLRRPSDSSLFFFIHILQLFYNISVFNKRKLFLFIFKIMKIVGVITFRDPRFYDFLIHL